MNARLTVRPATSADLSSIVSLLTDSSLTTEGVEDILRASPDTFFVAETPTDRQIVGVAGLEVCCDDALLRSVAVSPAWRSTRVGKQLIEQAIAHAEARGIRALYLLTLTAERYFPKFGFERIARDVVPEPIANTVEFKSACPASACVMRRNLSEQLANPA